MDKRQIKKRFSNEEKVLKKHYGKDLLTVVGEMEKAGGGPHWNLDLWVHPVILPGEPDYNTVSLFEAAIIHILGDKLPVFDTTGKLISYVRDNYTRRHFHT